MADAAGSIARRSSPLLHRNDLLGAVARFWHRSWAPDYIALGLLLVAEVLIQLLVQPFHRLFYLSNPSIQYPHAEHERVPPLLLLLYAAGIPLAVLVLWAIATQPGLNLAHATFLGLLLSLFLTGFVTDVIKNAVGRPRPDLLARCHAAPDTPSNVLVGVDVCTTVEPHLLHDGWRSFPSGHSSFSFAGLGYLSLFLVAQLRATHHTTPLPVALLALAPALGALLIAISRTEDYRHDVWDVTAGSLLGMLGAWLGWRRYFVAVASSVPHVHGGTTSGGGRSYAKDGRRGRADVEEADDEGEELAVTGGLDEAQRMLSGGAQAGRANGPSSH